MMEAPLLPGLRGKRILITGGAGFIGSHFVRYAMNTGADRVWNIDLLTYAGDTRRTEEFEGNDRYRFFRGDVTSEGDVDDLFRSLRPDLAVHFAAQTHVTRGEVDPDIFYRTNLEGSSVILDSVAKYGVRLVHVSTDEVYGPILSGFVTEEAKVVGDSQATNTYSRSKSLADDLAQSYSDRADVIVVRPTNVFGEAQSPEKAIARWITRALIERPLLVWGDGLHVRQWMYVNDCCAALDLLAEKGEAGGVYNIGPHRTDEPTNLAIARWIANYVGLPEKLVVLTEYDRPNHDRRYGVDSAKLTSMGWQPSDLWPRLAETIEWYRTRWDWWQPLVEDAESIYADAWGPDVGS